MGHHTFFLEVTVSGRDIETAAKKLKFIGARKDILGVSCSAALNSQGNWYPPLKRWPFKRFKKDNCMSRRDFDEAVKKEIEKWKSSQSRSKNSTQSPTPKKSKSKRKTTRKPRTKQSS